MMSIIFQALTHMWNHYEDKDMVISTIVSALLELVHDTREDITHSLLLAANILGLHFALLYN